ncbi:MAG: cellulase family glycosylhydrolase [Tepidisphaeraceae bacterium]
MIRPYRTASFIALALATGSIAAPLPTGPIPDGLGFNIHFTHEQPGELDQLAAAGVSTVRMDLFWARTEREPGRYDFSDYLKLMNDLDARHLRAQFILCYANPNYDAGLSPHTDAGRAAFARWAAEAAKTFRGRNVQFEIYNEPNIGFWKPKPDVEAYTKLALETSRAMHAIDPDAVIVGPASSGVPLDFLETVFKSGILEHWSAVTVHPYRSIDPETAEADYRALRTLIRRHAPAGKTIPIWSGEWGYSSAWSSFDDARQAKFLPRQWLFNISQGVPQSIWYDWRDDGTDPAEPEHHFGTVGPTHTGNAREPFAPKLACHAVRKLTSELRGLRFNKRLWTGDGRDWVLLFANDDASQTKLAVWTTSAEPREVSLPDRAKLTLRDEVQYLSPSNVKAWTAIAQLETCSADTVVDAPAQLADGSTLLRGDAPRCAISVAQLPNGVIVEQVTHAVAANAVSIIVEPVGSYAFSIRIENPSGRAIGDGRMRQQQAKADADGNIPLTIGLPEGQTSATLSVLRQPLPSPQKSPPMFVCIDTVGNPLARVAIPQATDIPLLRAAFRLNPDGDVKVRAKVELVDTAHDGPVGRDDSSLVGVSYDFDAGWKFVELNPSTPVAIPDRADHIGVWVYGDNSGNILRCRFIDSGDETWQPDGPALNWTGWRYVEFPLDGTRSGHWGGDKNGHIDRPLRLITLLLVDSANKQATSGMIRVALPMFVERSNP